MLEEKKKYLTWILFPSKQDLRPSLFKVYVQAGTKMTLFTHLRKQFTTYIIDLTQDEAVLLQNYSPKLRQKLRKAAKQGIKIERDQDPTEVIRLFQSAIDVLKLNALTEESFTSKPNLIITRAIDPEHGVLIAHAYLIDESSSTVKSEYNTSAFRLFENNKAARNACGRANYYLYHQDFLYFKSLGLKTFDFGGYDGGTPSVDYFKDQFCGAAKVQYNYFPYWYALIRLLRGKL